MTTHNGLNIKYPRNGNTYQAYAFLHLKNDLKNFVYKIKDIVFHNNV